MMYINSCLSNLDSLAKCLEAERLKWNEPMSLHTSFKVGGLADLLYITETSGDLVKAVRLCQTFSVPLTVLGVGSGVIVSELGIRGLVIINKSERVQIKPQRRGISNFFRKIDPKKVEVTIDGGVSIDKAIEKLKLSGVVGFEKYKKFSGTVGGMVADGGRKEELMRVSIIDSHGAVKSIDSKKGLDGYVVTDATFRLSFGKPEEIKENNKSINKIDTKKRVRRIFMDLKEEEKKIFNYPTGDAGYIVGEILNMKGFRIGKAMIPEDNANAIENLGGATAKDFVAVIEEVKSRARETLGIELIEKVVRLGEF